MGGGGHFEHTLHVSLSWSMHNTQKKYLMLEEKKEWSALSLMGDQNHGSNQYTA